MHFPTLYQSRLNCGAILLHLQYLFIFLQLKYCGLVITYK